MTERAHPIAVAAMVLWIVSFFMWLVVLAVVARADPQEHETEARVACRHILSPAMATAHQEYEKHLYWRCVELQRKVPWRLTDGQF